MKNLLFYVFLLTILCFENANSQNWTSVGTGMDDDIFCIYADTVNNLLYAGGYFTNAGSSPASCIAVWDGISWNSLGAGISGVNGQVKTLIMYNGELYAGGHFSTAGGNPVSNIAKWNGSSWSDVGGGVNSSAFIENFAEYNGELYVGGYLFTDAGTTIVNNIAKWNGSSWSSVGSGINSGVQALCVYNGELFAAGEITQAGGINVNNIARWNGATWSDVNGGTDSRIFSMCTYNNELIVGGNFSSAGSSPALNIAKWNGTNWNSISTGIDYMVDALATFDGSLYAGGLFWNAGGIPVNNITVWNGSNWDSLGMGIQDLSLNSTPIVRSLTVYNSCLYAGGIFNTSIGSVADYIAKWDCETLGITDNFHIPKYAIIPNPSSFESVISSNHELQDATLMIYNSKGKKIKEFDKINGKSFTLTLSDLSSGLYLIKIQNNEILHYSKLQVISTSH